MSQLPTESGQQAGAPGATPDPSTTGDQPISQAPLSEADVRRIAREETERGSQSRHDRRMGKVEKEQEALRAEQQAQREILDSIGQKMKENPTMTYETAVREVQVDRMLARNYQPAPSDGPDETDTLTGAENLILDSFELNTSDPEVLSAVRDADGNQRVLIAKLKALTVARATKPAPKAGQAASTPSGAPPSVEATASTILKEYNAELSQIPRGNTHAVSMLKARYRERARKAGLQFNV